MTINGTWIHRTDTTFGVALWSCTSAFIACVFISTLGARGWAGAIEPMLAAHHLSAVTAGSAGRADGRHRGAGCDGGDAKHGREE